MSASDAWLPAADAGEGFTSTTHPSELRPWGTQARHRRRRRPGPGLWDLDADGQGPLVGGAPATGPVERLAWRGDDRALAAIDAAGGLTVWHCAGALRSRWEADVAV